MLSETRTHVARIFSLRGSLPACQGQRVVNLHLNCEVGCVVYRCAESCDIVKPQCCFRNETLKDVADDVYYWFGAFAPGIPGYNQLAVCRRIPFASLKCI